MKVDDQHVVQNVLAKTRKLLLSHGVKGWNMDMLAAESGLAKNTLYKIVGSKEKIIEEVVLAHVRKNSESVVAFLKENADWADRGKMMAVLRESFAIFAGTMSNFEPVILPQVYLQYPAIEPKVNALVLDLSGLAMAFFEQGKQAGFIRADVDVAAAMDVARGMVDFYIQRGTDQALFRARIAKIFEYMLTGILA